MRIYINFTCSQFPELKNSIRGEEDNKFCNTLGESIIVEIKDTPEFTSDLLSVVLNGNKIAANLLSREVHKLIQLNDVNTSAPPNDIKLDLTLDNLGIWIDPIGKGNPLIQFR